MYQGHTERVIRIAVKHIQQRPLNLPRRDLGALSNGLTTKTHFASDAAADHLSLRDDSSTISRRFSLNIVTELSNIVGIPLKNAYGETFHEYSQEGDGRRLRNQQQSAS